MIYDAKVLEGYEQAKQVRLNAHAPYSNFLVGTAIKIKDSDEFYVGCNVENASYGGTVCAERNAVFNIIAENGKCEFDFLVLVCDTKPASIPCALCLQVLSEFVGPDFPIFLANLEGIERELKFKDLLPITFDTLFS